MPTQLLSIVASDGRQLTFTYFSGTDQVQSASDGARAWAYAYTPGPQSWDTGVQRTTYYLSGITLPDGSTWRFNLQPLHRALL